MSPTIRPSAPFPELLEINVLGLYKACKEIDNRRIEEYSRWSTELYFLQDNQKKEQNWRWDKLTKGRLC